MNKKTRRAISTILFNAGLYYLAYLALILSVEGAGNVLCVFAAIHLMAGFLALCMKEVHKGAYLRGPSIPVGANSLIDLTLVVALLWFGWWWTGIAFLLGTIFQHALYTINPDEHES